MITTLLSKPSWSTALLRKSSFKYFKNEALVFHILLYGKQKIFKCFRCVLYRADRVWLYTGNVFIEFICNVTIVFYRLSISIYWFRKPGRVEFTFSFEFFCYFFIICHVHFMSLWQSLNKMFKVFVDLLVVNGFYFLEI